MARLAPVLGFAVLVGFFCVQALNATPAAADSLRASSISAGGGHTCAIRASGQAICWGGASKLGHRAPSRLTPTQMAPAPLRGLGRTREISNGGAHICAIRASRRAVCWGWNYSGQIGNGTTAQRVATPTPVRSGVRVKAIDAGVWHTCAIGNTDRVTCWGDNGSGQLGNGTARGDRGTSSRRSPTRVRGLTGAKAVSVGQWHSCAIRASGQVVCWGDNGSDQLGGGIAGDRRLSPSPVKGLADAKAISAGQDRTCAIRASGQAVCWGANHSGSLGNGTETTWYPDLPPVPVVGLNDAKAISAGWSHTCAIRASGQTVCWGDNDFGQLGDGTRTDRWTPVAVDGLDDAIAVSAGWSHTCAIRASGQVVCWGENGLGQLGDGTRTDRLTPTFVRATRNRPRSRPRLSIAKLAPRSATLRVGRGGGW